MNLLKYIFFSLFVALLLLPLFQTHFGIFREKPLNGFFILNEAPDLKKFTWQRWFDGSFQDQVSRGVEDHLSIRNSLFRIHNQYDYSLFGISHAQGFIKGKNNYLFEEDYILEYTGKYFIGKKTLERKFRKLKALQDQLKAMNIVLVPVIEPGKASYFPEHIPGRYRPDRRSLTNQEYFTELFNQFGISYLDLNSYFLQQKKSSPYPLFPNYGMHWSIYGVSIAADTLIRYIENLYPGSMPEISIGNIVISDSLRSTDNDIGHMLNLVCPLPKVKAAYPEISFIPAPDRSKISALVIADSYYLNMVNDIGGKIFGNHEYWYYNSKVYPAIIDNDNPVYIDKSNLREKFSEFDLILLMTSEINMHCCWWNFIDEAHQALNPGYVESRLYAKENQIRNEREWFRFMVAKARKQGKTLEEMIRTDAEYLFYNEFASIPDKTGEDTISRIMIDIRNNPEWLKVVADKAEKFNVPLDEMIEKDARYTYDKQKNQ